MTIETSKSIARLATAVVALSLFGNPGMVLAEDGALALEEIIVTAQKREQSLSEVPISVTAISGEKIESSKVDDLADLSEYVPGVHISRGPVNTAINIRGIGSGLVRSFEQSVGMYIDGVYMGRGRQYRSPFLDIERVEFLRGPQGILFGKNTIAGAINVITKSPKAGEDMNGYITARYEPDDETVDLSGAVSVPLGKTAALRLAGKWSDSDGYLTNGTTGEPGIQPENKLIRATLVWNASDRLDFNLKVSRSEFKTAGTALTPRVFKLIDDPKAPLDALAFALVTVVQPDFDNSDPHRSYIEDFPMLGRSGPEGTDTESDNIGLTWNYRFDSAAVLTSVTSYSSFDAVDSQDVDFLPIRLLTRFDDRRFKQVSQELRIVSPGDGVIDYIAGVYAERQDLDLEEQIGLDSSLGGLTNVAVGVPSVFAPQLGPFYSLFPVVEISRNGAYSMDAETYAAFAEITYNATDKMRLSIGLRYSREKKDVAKSLTLGSDVTGGLDTPSDSPLLAAIWGGAFATFAHDIRGARKSSHWDPSVKIQWDATDNAMLYLNYSQGFKSGGFNSADDLNVTQVGPDGEIIGFEYDDETAKSLELGLKSALAGGAARLNIAAFFTRYDDLQVSSFQGTNFSVSNAAKADIKGIEADVVWRLSNELTLSGSIAYLDFEFKSYATAPCTAAKIAATPVGEICVEDLSGRTNAFAPKWSGNLGASYSRDVTDRLTLNMALDVNFKSDMFIDYDLDADAKQQGYAKLNARVAVEGAGGAWWLAAYGRNLTDKVTFGYSVDTPLVTASHSGVPLEGRVLGLEAGMRF